MCEPHKQPQWGEDKAFPFVAAMIFLFVGVPLLMILDLIHKLSQLH